MTDTVKPEVRSRMMAAIKGRDTGPELSIRKGLHSLGFRYSLHSRNLPGKPDIVFRKYRAVVWVHGCFWHGHDCGEAREPASNMHYWSPKIQRTRDRDAAARKAVEAMGWRCLTIWECSIRGKGAIGTETVIERAARWFLSGDPSAEIHKNY